MNESSPSVSHDHDLRRNFLLAAFEDTEATIRATDTKASIALVVHGFIFAAMVGILSNLGDGFLSASSCFRTLVIALSSLDALLFLGSITQLLRCVMPAPKSVIPETPARGLFHLSANVSPLSGRITLIPTFEALHGQVATLTASDIEVELTAELCKVSAIRARKTTLAREGFELLGFEVGVSVVLLVSLGIYFA